jgi:hypothetical protein
MERQRPVNVHDGIEVLGAGETMGKDGKSGWLLVERQIQASGEPFSIRVLKIELLKLHDGPPRGSVICDKAAKAAQMASQRSELTLIILPCRAIVYRRVRVPAPLGLITASFWCFTLPLHIRFPLSRTAVDEFAVVTNLLALREKFH